jgi:hypothetical protein
MGAWGPGNFDNDAAGDFRDEVILNLVRNMERSLETEDLDNFDLDDIGDGLLMPSADLLLTLCKFYRISPMIAEDKLSVWKDQYLAIFDEVIDTYGAKDEYKKERRAVISNTFDELIVLSRQYPP